VVTFVIDKRGGNRIVKFHVMLPDVSNSYTFRGSGGILWSSKHVSLCYYMEYALLYQAAVFLCPYSIGTDISTSPPWSQSV